MTVSLVCVVHGSAYEAFAENLFDSAEEFFQPGCQVRCVMLSGRSGWPAATMYRHHVLRDHMPETDWVFLSDADMIFEGYVDGSILPVKGISATLHPGFVHVKSPDLPFERRENSAACIKGYVEHYYCGGFVGGTRDAMARLSASIAAIVDVDAENQIVPVWHDESCLNKVLWSNPPEKMLTPAYCCPDDDTWYRTVWPEQYPRKLVALDKDNVTRGHRG